MCKKQDFNKMNDKHLTEEIIIGWIEKTQPKSIYDNVTVHLQKCDQCFTRYCLLQSSLTESVEVKLEHTPVDFLKYAQKKLGLKPVVIPKKNLLNKLRNKINQMSNKIFESFTIPNFNLSFNGILRPRLIPIGVISVGIIAIMLTLFNPTTRDPQPDDLAAQLKEEEKYLQAIEDVKQPGINLRYSSDTLWVTQSVIVTNTIIIKTANDAILYSAKFAELKTPILIWEHIDASIFRNKYVNVQIIALEEVVVDTSLLIF
jgi:hypothetical protein